MAAIMVSGSEAEEEEVGIDSHTSCSHTSQYFPTSETQVLVDKDDDDGDEAPTYVPTTTGNNKSVVIIESDTANKEDEEEDHFER
jgi:hypothetical protein